MKKLILAVLLSCLLVLPVLGALKPNSCYDDNGRFTFVYVGTSTERDAVPSGVWTIEEGDLWYDTDADVNELHSYDGSEWKVVNEGGAGGGGAPAGSGTDDTVTLDDAYDGGGSGVGYKITVDVLSKPVTLTNTVAQVGPLLSVSNYPASSANASGIYVVNNVNSTGYLLSLMNSGSGYSILASNNYGAQFYVAADGSIFGNTLTLDSGGIIANSTDSEFKFTEAGEDLIFDMDYSSNQIQVKSSTGVSAIDWSGVDTFSSIDSITFLPTDAGHGIGLESDGDAEDLTIAVTGATDSTLILVSSGTGADALTVSTSAGGMDLTVAGAAAGEDLDLVSNVSINLTASEAAADAIVLEADTAAGGIDITSNADIDITTTGEAGEDITLTNTGGSINVTATEDDSGAVYIQENGGTSGAIKIHANQGASVTEGAYSVELLSDDGGVELRSTANLAKSVALTSDGGATGSIWIFNDQGESAAEGSASIQLLSDAGGINIKSNLDNSNAVLLTADGGTSATMVIHNDQGTGASSIQIVSDDGSVDVDAGDNLDIDVADNVTIDTTDGSFTLNANGTDNGDVDVNAVDDMTLTVGGDFALNPVGSVSVDTGDGAVSIVSDGAANGDITIDAEDQITIVSTDSDGTNSIYIHANGGASENIKVHSDQGTGAASIELLSDAGGITATASDATAGDLLLTLGDDVTIDAGGKVTISSATASANGDIKLDAEAASLVLDSGEDAEDAITLVCTSGDGGIDITSLGDIDITTTGAAGQDISLTNTGGSVNITATEEAADAISLVATTGAGGITLNAGTAGITMSDDTVDDVGDLYCDDIVSDGDHDVMYMTKTVVKTIDANSTGSTDDFSCDETQDNTTEQPIDCGEIIPAYAEIVSCQLRCFETFGDSNEMTIDVGVTTGDGSIITAATCDTANDILTTEATGGPELAATNAARHIWVNFTPTNNWDETASTGRWAIMVTYIDYGAVYTQKSP
jgi:hypothetical protein